MDIAVEPQMGFGVSRIIKLELAGEVNIHCFSNVYYCFILLWCMRGKEAEFNLLLKLPMSTIFCGHALSEQMLLFAK